MLLLARLSRGLFTQVPNLAPLEVKANLTFGAEFLLEALVQHPRLTRAELRAEFREMSSNDVDRILASTIQCGVVRRTVASDEPNVEEAFELNPTHPILDTLFSAIERDSLEAAEGLEASQLELLKESAMQIIRNFGSMRESRSSIQDVPDHPDASELFKQPLKLGDVTLHPHSGDLRLDSGTVIPLTSLELGLLEVLLLEPGKTITKQSLWRRAGRKTKVVTRTLDVHVHRIRRKLQDAGSSCLRIDTVRGEGYRLTVAQP
jgi:DNA-binding winged helix-turn-helix (wHTH) protein